MYIQFLKNTGVVSFKNIYIPDLAAKWVIWGQAKFSPFTQYGARVDIIVFDLLLPFTILYYFTPTSSHDLRPASPTSS